MNMMAWQEWWRQGAEDSHPLVAAVLSLKGVFLVTWVLLHPFCNTFIGK
jgi:hypothetical protein